MKRGKFIFAYIIFISLIFLNSCSNENLVGVSKDSKSKGSVALKINNNAPSEVQQLTAFLSRSGYDTLETSISINNDSLNVLSFEAVPVGNWHLFVEAKNSAGKITYSGETDITIIEDETIDAYLTLTNTGSGTGNINLYINWDSSSKWIDYVNNPIFTINDGPSSVIALGAHIVYLDNGTYKMWYSGTNSSGNLNVYYAESIDGINWVKKTDTPVLSPGQPGTWDDYSVGVGAIIKENGIFKMYYQGWHDVNGEWSVGLATSTDGIQWQKKDVPVLTPSSNENQLGPWSIMKINNLYYLYYTNRDYPYYSINLAISQDGINWNEYENNPILKVTKEWEGMGVYQPSVIYDQGNFEMVYMSSNANAFGYAVSNDGINWKKDDNPIFTQQNIYNNWSNRIIYPDYHKFDNEYWLYYSGDGGSIGLAIK